MRKLKFLCVEDDCQFVEYLKKAIIDYFQKYGYDVVFEIYNHIPKNIKLDQIDACLLDIEIENQTTIQLMEKIRKIDMYIPILVITSHDHYVFDTVHMQIFDFIRKSKIKMELKRSLSKLRNYIKGTTDEIVVSTDRGNYRIHFKDILYVHIHSHYISIHRTIGDKIELWKNYDDIFPNEIHFVRSHKSYAINMFYCEQLDKSYAYLKNCKKPIPISRRNYKKVSDIFIKNNSLMK